MADENSITCDVMDEMEHVVFHDIASNAVFVCHLLFHNCK